MIQSINGTGNVYGRSSLKSIGSILENISPNELETMVCDLYKDGEISLKDTLAFRILDTSNLQVKNGGSVKIKYASEVWERPNTKRNMLAQYQNMLNEQIKDGDSSQNIEFTRNAINVLKKLERKYSFKSVLQGMQ